jgi:hypothetical protein
MPAHRRRPLGGAALTATRRLLRWREEQCSADHGVVPAPTPDRGLSTAYGQAAGMITSSGIPLVTSGSRARKPRSVDRPQLRTARHAHDSRQLRREAVAKLCTLPLLAGEDVIQLMWRITVWRPSASGIW